MRTVSDQEVIREFLIESSENLNRLDQEIVELEQRPEDKRLLASVFRCFHTIKGSCGFLGFSRLERVTHHAENLLSQLRSGERRLTGELVALILEVVDAVRRILAAIERDGTEGPDECADLVSRLDLAHQERPSSAGAESSAENQPAANTKGCAVAESAIRVDLGLLDKLMNLVGELVLTRNQVLQFTAQREDRALNATSQRLNLITTELQENVMKTRMQPIGVVWNKLPRLVRDLSHACGKQVRLETEGSDTELDKTIIEAIKDPLTHLVRNCCDHGIERPEDRVRAGKPAQGVIRLKAYHEGGQVNIEISDDGAGIDVAQVKQKAIEKGLVLAEQAGRMGEREALHLMFLPGVSTARAVTNVSGRGVGMDVVRSNVEKIGSIVDVATVAGHGTVFKLKIPLTLAIIPGLVVSSGGERFLIPQASLLELIRLDGDSSGRIEYVHGTPVFRRRGRLLPVAFLNQVLGLPNDVSGDVINIVVLQAEDRQFGLVVDGIQDTQEIVVKPLGKQLKGLSVYAGATIMGDGRVALILDVLGVGQRSGVLEERAEQAEQARAEAQTAAGTVAEKQRLLLFRSGSFTRLAVPLALVARLEEFPQAQMERAGGCHVVQYRGGLLNVVSLSRVLSPDAPDAAAASDPVPVIVFTDGDRSLGIMVDQIVDIVEDAVAVRQPGKVRGLLGSAVVGKFVTDFLDVRAVVQAAAVEWFENSRTATKGTVLLAESSGFVRGLVRGELEMAGYQVLEAASLDEAMACLDHHEVNTVLASIALAPSGGAGLRDAMRRRPSLASVPVVLLSGSTEVTGPCPEGFDAYQTAADRNSMVRCLERLAAAASQHGVPAAPAEAVRS